MRRRDFLLAAAAPLALRPALVLAARQNGGTPRILVTADTEAAVIVVDPLTGGEVRRIATPPGPRGIEILGRGRVALVLHPGPGAVSIVDAWRLRLRSVLRGFSDPRYAAGSPDGRLAYVTDSGAGRLVVVDLERARVLRSLDLGGPCRHVTIAPDGGTLWTALGNAADEVAIVDLSDPLRPALRRRLPTPDRAHDVAYSADGSQIWVSSGARRRLTVYSARTGSPRFRVAADEPPQHFAMLAGGAWVTSGDSGTLRLHGLADGRLRATLAIPHGSYNLAEGGGFVVTPSLDRGTIAVVGTEGRRLRSRRRVTASAHDACVVTTP